MEIHGFGQMPEEFIKMLAQQQDRGNMKMEVEQTAMDNFLDSLTKDQTLNLKNLIYRINCSTGSEGPPPMGVYVEGLLVGALRYRFNVCPGCGDDHTASLFDGHKDENIDGLAESAENEDGSEQPSLFESPDEAFFVPTEAPASEEEITKEDGDDNLATFYGVDDLTVGQVKEMTRLNLDDLREDESCKLLGFRCTECGKQYVSIEDRALRPEGVEGCTGCQQKAKWG